MAYNKRQEKDKLKPKKGVRKLTDKQRAYVRLRIENPKMSKTKAVMQVYDTDKPNNAGAIASTLDKNEAVQSALIAHTRLAEGTIVKAIMDYGDSEKQWERTLAVETSKWVHDKIFGKAVQQNVNVNQNFTEQAKEERDKYGL